MERPQSSSTSQSQTALQQYPSSVIQYDSSVMGFFDSFINGTNQQVSRPPRMPFVPVLVKAVDDIFDTQNVFNFKQLPGLLKYVDFQTQRVRVLVFVANFPFLAFRQQQQIKRSQFFEVETEMRNICFVSNRFAPDFKMPDPFEPSIGLNKLIDKFKNRFEKLYVAIDAKQILLELFSRVNQTLAITSYKIFKEDEQNLQSLGTTDQLIPSICSQKFAFSSYQPDFLPERRKQFKQSVKSLHKQLFFSSLMKTYKSEMKAQYAKIYSVVAEHLLEHRKYSEMLSGFFDEIDAQLTFLVQEEKKTQIACGVVRIGFNFQLIRKIISLLRGINQKEVMLPFEFIGAVQLHVIPFVMHIQVFIIYNKISQSQERMKTSRPPKAINKEGAGESDYYTFKQVMWHSKALFQQIQLEQFANVLIAFKRGIWMQVGYMPANVATQPPILVQFLENSGKKGIKAMQERPGFPPHDPEKQFQLVYLFDITDPSTVKSVNDITMQVSYFYDALRHGSFSVLVEKQALMTHNFVINNGSVDNNLLEIVEMDAYVNMLSYYNCEHVYEIEESKGDMPLMIKFQSIIVPFLIETIKGQFNYQNQLHQYNQYKQFNNNYSHIKHYLYEVNGDQMTSLKQYQQCLIFKDPVFTFDFYDLAPIISALIDQIRYIENLKMFRFTSGMLYFNVDKLVDQQKAELQRAYADIRHDVHQYLLQVNVKLYKEVQSITSQLDFAQVNPFMQDHIKFTKEKFLDKKYVDNTFTQLFQSFHQNVESFVTIFGNEGTEDFNDKIAAYLQFIKLFKLQKRACFFFGTNYEFLKDAVQQCDVWMIKQVEKLMEYMKQVLSLDNLSLEEMVNNPIKFSLKLPIVAHNFELDRIVIDGSRAMVGSFYISLCQATTAKILTDDWFKLGYLFEPETNVYQHFKPYKKSIYTSVQHDVKIEPLLIKDILNEIRYYCQELMCIQKAIENYRKFVLQFFKPEEVVTQKLLESPSIFQVCSAVTPIFVLVDDLELLQQQFSQLSELRLHSLDTKVLMNSLEKLTCDIHIIRKHIDQGVNVLSYSNSLKNQYQKKYDYFTAIQNQVYKFSYEKWINYLVFAEDFVLKFAPSLNFLYLITQNEYSEVSKQLIQNYLKINLDTCTVKIILDVFEDNNTTFDFLNQLWAVSEVNFLAAKQLMKVHKLFNQIFIESTYQNKIYQKVMPMINLSELKNQRDLELSLVPQVYPQEDVDANTIINMLIIPSYVEEICADSNFVTSSIINNYAFMNPHVVDTKFDFELNFVHIHHNFETIFEQLPQEIKCFSNYLLVWKYDKNVEGLARDLEMIDQLIKIMYTCLKRIPNLIHDLLLVFYNGNPIRINDANDVVSIGLLSDVERYNVIKLQSDWTKLVAQFQKPGLQTKLIDLVIDQKFTKQVFIILSQLQEIHLRILNSPFSHIINKYSAPFDPLLRVFSQEKKLSPQFVYEIDNQQFYANKSLIPTYNFNYYPLATMMPVSMQINFAAYNILYNPVKMISMLQNELFINLTDITMDSKIEKITAVVSHNEILIFNKPIEIPDSLMLVFDYILKVSGGQLKQNVLKAIDEFFVAVQKYEKLRANLPPLYFAKAVEGLQQQMDAIDLTQQNQILKEYYNSLPEYLKVFESFLNQYVFTAIFVAIYNYISSFYQTLYSKSITGRLERNDFKSIYFLLNDLKIVIFCIPDTVATINQQNFQLKQFWRRSISFKLQEWEEIFKASIGLFQCKDNTKIMAYNIQFPYVCLDQVSNQLMITDSRQTFKMSLGNHWIGAASQFDVLQLSNNQLKNLGQLISSLSSRQVVFLLGSIEKQFSNIDCHMITKSLSRLMFRRSITVLVTQFSFAQNVKKISASLAAGYIVIIVGIEFLPSSQVLQLADIAKSVTRKRGKLSGLVTAFDTRDKVPDEFGIVSKILVKDVDISLFDDPGYLVFFVPALKTVQTATDFKFSEPIVLDDETKKLTTSFATLKKDLENINVQETYQELYQPDQNIVQLINCFSNSTIINIEQKEAVQLFTETSIHGYAFYEISIFLRQFNALFPKLSYTDMQLIYQKCKDARDSMCVAMITLDFLMKQMISLIRVDQRTINIPTLIASYINGAFGLDKNNSQTINGAAKAFQQYIETLLVHIGYQSQGQFTPGQKKYTFEKYFKDFILRYSEQGFVQAIFTHSSLFSIPVQTIYDITFCNDVLKHQKPVLIVSIHQSYLKIFVSMYASIYKRQIFYVTTREEISISLRTLSVQKNAKQPLFVIVPSSLKEIESMADQLFGFFQLFPIIQDDYGVPYYQNDKNLLLEVMFCIDSDMFFKFSEIQLAQIFQHRFILFPSIEGSDGARKVFLTPLQVDQTFIKDQYFRIPQIANILKPGIQFVTSSPSIEYLLKLYQSRMVYSEIKQFQMNKLQERVLVLQQLSYGITSCLFEIVTRIFNIGRSYEELLVMRSMFYFFLCKFKVIRPAKRQFENKFLQLADKEVGELTVNEDQRRNNIDDMVVKDFNSLGFDVFARKSAFMYKIQQFFMRKSMAEKKPTVSLNQKLSDPYQGVDFSRMITDSLSIGRMNVSDQITTNIDIAGFLQQDFNNIVGLLPELKKKKGNQIKEEINSILTQNILKDLIPMGCGNFGSQVFDFDDNFILKAYVQNCSLITAYQEICKPFIISMWNAASLYFMTITNSGKQSLFSNKSFVNTINNRYETYLIQIKSISESQSLFQNILQIPFQLMQSEKNQTKYAKIVQLNNVSVLTNQENTELHSFVKELFTVDFMPIHVTDQFQYVNYVWIYNMDPESKDYQLFQTTVTMEQYQIGSGIFKNISLLQDSSLLREIIKQLCSENLVYRKKKLHQIDVLKKQLQSQDTKELEKNMYTKLKLHNLDSQDQQSQSINVQDKVQSRVKNPYDSDDEDDLQSQKQKKNEQQQLIQETIVTNVKELDELVKLDQNFEMILKQIDGGQPQISLQRISDILLCFDPQRTALITTIACCMMSPTSFALVGVRGSGKSILIKVAQIIAKDYIDVQKFVVGELKSSSSGDAFKSAIFQKFQIRNYEVASQCRYYHKTQVQYQKVHDFTLNDRFLDYSGGYGFPVFYIHASDVVDQEINSEICNLIKSHMIKIDKVDSQFQRFQGTSVLSDCSFVLECLPSSPLIQLCAIQFQVPLLSDQFAQEVLKMNFPDVDEQYVKQFITGHDLVKQSLPKELQNNFAIFEKIINNRQFIIQQGVVTNDKFIDKVQIYETNGIEFEDSQHLTPVLTIFKNCNDRELARLGIHSYFNVLRSLKSVEQIQIENSCEKLASLCLLNKLKVNNVKNKELAQKQFEETPWSDSSIMLDNNFIIYPAWQAFVINECVQNAKRPTEVVFENLRNNFSTIASKLQPVFLRKKNCFFHQVQILNNQDILSAINMVVPNQFWFAHFMELFRLYGQTYEPFLLQMVFQLFILISRRFEHNYATLQSILQFNCSKKDSIQSIVGLQASDDQELLKKYIMEKCFRFSALVGNYFQQNDSLQTPIDIEFNALLNEDLANNKYSVPETNGSSLGFSLLSNLSFKPLKFIISLTNYDEKRSAQFISLLSDIFAYTIFGQTQQAELVTGHQQLQVPGKKKDENKFKIYTEEDLLLFYRPLPKFEKIFEAKEKIIVNVNDIVNQTISYDVNQNQIILALKQMYSVLQKSKKFTSDEIQFILIMSILRLFVLMSLGINYNLGLLDDISEITSNFVTSIGLDCKSKIQSFLPNKTMVGGSNIDQVTFFCRDNEMSVQRFQQYNDHSAYLYQYYECQLSNQKVAIPKQKNPIYQVEFRSSDDKRKIFSQYFADFKQIILVINLSLLNQKTKSGVSIQSLFTRLLEPQSTLPTIFDFEELNVICNIMATRLNVSQMIDSRQLSNIISTNLATIVFDDTPINTKSSTQHIAFEELGNINTPILSLISNLAKQYELINAQFNQQKLQDGKQKQHGAVLQSLNETNVKSQNAYDQYVKAKINKSKFNIFEIGSRDLLSLFKLSNCQLPKDFVMPANLGINVNNFKNQFALVSVAVYRMMHSYSKTAICSISCFSRLASQICDLLLNKVQSFFQHVTVISTLVKFYTALAEPLKSPIKPVDIASFKTEYIKNQILQQIDNQLNIAKQKGLPIPNDRQVDLQKASGEAVYIRDYLITIQQVMNDDLNVFAHIAQTAHFSAIGAAAFMLFGATDAIDLKITKEAILSGQFGNVGSSIIQLFKSEDIEVSMFNIFFLSILRSLNISVVHPDYHKKKQLIPEFVEMKQLNDNDQILLGSQTLLFGKYLFVSDVAEILSNDWAVYLILKALKIPWQPNDEVYSEINSILLQFTTGSRQFIVPQSIGMAASAAISSLFLQKKDPKRMFYPDIGRAIHLGPEAKEYQQVSQEFLKAVMVADMTNPYVSDFISVIVKAFEQPDQVLLISNFGRPNVPHINNVIMKYIITLVLSRKTVQNQKIVIQEHDIILAQDLHTIPIILTVSPDINLQQTIQDFGFYTQYFMDTFSINCPLMPSITEGTNNTKLINYQKLYIQQQLQSNLFGERQSSRSTNEMVKVCSLACNALIMGSLIVMQKYIMGFILSIIYTPQEMAVVKLDAITLNRLQQMTSTNELLQRTLLMTSFIITNRPEQIGLMDTIFNLFMRLNFSYVNKYALLSDKIWKVLVGDHNQIEFTCQYLLKTDVNRLTSELAFALTCSAEFLKSISIYHFPSVSISSMDTFNDLFLMLNKFKDKYIEELVQKLALLPKIKPPELSKLKDEQVEWMFVQYPLIYHVHQEYNAFKIFLVGKILPYISERIFNIFPNDYATAIWLANSLLFLTLTNIITSNQSADIGHVNIDDLEGFIRLLSQSVDDNIKHITSFQLSQVFSQSSSFSLFKLYSELQLKFLKYIDNTQQILPEICSISSQLVYSWLQMNQLARFNAIMKKAMPWFVVNHASFVSFCLSDNVFIAVIMYFMLKNPPKASVADSPSFQWFAKQLGLSATNKQNKLIELPIGFRVPDSACFFVSFILSIALKQHQLVENIEILACSMSHLFGESPRFLRHYTQPSAEKFSSAIVLHKYLDKITYENLTTNQIERFMVDSYTVLMKLVGLDFNKQQPLVISDGLYQLYNLIFHSYKLIQQYSQSIQQFQQQNLQVSEIMSKAGPSPLLINIIYYDQQIAAEQLVEFCHETIDQSFVNNKQLSISTTSSIYQLMDGPVLLDANPSMNGAVALQALLGIIREKPTAALITIIYPVFVLIPSGYQSASLHTFSPCGQFNGQKKQIEQFLSLLSLVCTQAQPNTSFLRKPSDLKASFTHGIGVALTAIRAQMQQLQLDNVKANNLLSNNIVTLRGFILLLLRHALLQSRAEGKDFMIIQTIQQIFNRTVSSQTQIDEKAPFLAIALADDLFFNQEAPLTLDVIDRRAHLLADKCSKRLNCGAHQMMDLYFPPILSQVVTKSRGIDEKIKNQMNVVIEENDNSESDAMSMSSSALSQSQRSFSSEISDNEQDVDIDDNMSLYSSRSKTSQISKASQKSTVSSASSSSTTMTQRFGSKNMSEKNQAEDHYYQNLLVSLQLHAGSMFRPINTEQIQKQIMEQIFCKQRKIKLYNVRLPPALEKFLREKYPLFVKLSPAQKHVDERSEYSQQSQQPMAPIQRLHVPLHGVLQPNCSVCIGYQDLLDFITQLALYQDVMDLDTRAPEYKQADQYRAQQQMLLPSTEKSTRRVMSSPELMHIIGQFKKDPGSSKRKSDLEQMPDLLSCFLQNLQDYQQVNYGSYGKQKDLNYVQQGLVDSNLTLENNLLLGARGFGQFQNHWIISANVFAPVLGDVFNFLRMYNSFHSNAALDRQRIIITTEIPRKQPKILQDGSIELADKEEKNKATQPFYIVLRNLELVGLSYDTELKTVVDCTPESIQGYCQTFDLYACAAVIDSWQKGDFDEQLFSQNPDQMFLHVCASHVPIPIKIGGYIRPIVLLPNRTRIKSEEYVKRGAFFAVKYF